ncbi:uncharacterized protein LOC100707456 [Oreochromis niloticus]|uniref:uncharacterized protein LOC100707456 n=1 Tax=Oreochromis niloticus TaxID=8128 RepID=UPI00022B0358|nr:uncharacterized protein LOC100707456 [Oreochromis niloticus]XP_005453190.1 uncharacterized protein LOC100707456 [Oreochromis niloticus]
MCTHWLEAPTMRGKRNTMFLESSDEEEQLGATKYEELIKQTLEKRVKLPADLRTFIKSSHAISKYQTLFQNFRHPVFIEVGSDLVLSSLSSADLDEALAAVVNDLSVEIVKLQGSAAVPPDLDRMKEVLMEAKNKENAHELKVDISFVPGSNGSAATKVRLVGYSENVRKLTDVLHDFQTNQVTTQEKITLPHPEMVDCFHKILDLTAMKQTKVPLRASYVPNPHVSVSGPRCQVQEAKQALMSALTSLTIETLALDGAGAQRYFKTEGKVSKELVENSCCVIIQEKRTVVTPNVSTKAYASNTVTITPQTLITGRSRRTLATTTIPYVDVSSLVQQVYGDSYKNNLSMKRENQDLSVLCTTHQRSVFLFLGLGKKSVHDAMKKVKDLYQAHCSTKKITKEELADFTQDEIKDLQKLVETQGLHVQQDQSGDGGLVVSGLKDGVTELIQMLHAAARLRREVRVREEDNLYPCVAWCILGFDGSWERLPKTDNYNLEHDIKKEIVDTHGNMWSVDLQKMEARSRFARKTKLKRLENRPDFTLPLYWDNMASGENRKAVPLEPSSSEYLKVKAAFTQTVQKTILKIERLQNVHLQQNYEVQKKKLSEKNRQDGGAGERLLYHGTSQDTCESIIKNGFDRSFSGKHATVYGQGTYFAVSASYSANPGYSVPAADGSQRVFVAQVLTGVYTQGNSSMKVPPPRTNQPDDRYDSLVDQIANPSMFIIFNDNQAYPDYLITFC